MNALSRVDAVHLHAHLAGEPERFETGLRAGARAATSMLETRTPGAWPITDQPGVGMIGYKW